MTTNTTTTATTRDYAAEYVAARLTARRAKTLNGSGDAIARAVRIARDAEKAGVRLDEIGLDEQARQQLIAEQPPAPRPQIIGYAVTGLPIYG